MHPSNDGTQARMTQLTADALGATSETLATVGERARKSGLALRDRGRDAARAASRGERVLREEGVRGGAVRLGGMARRHALGIVLVATGVAAAVVLGRWGLRDR